MFMGIMRAHESTRPSPWKYEAPGLVTAPDLSAILSVVPRFDAMASRQATEKDAEYLARATAAFRNWAPTSCRVILAACEALWHIAEHSPDEPARALATETLNAISHALRGLPPRAAASTSTQEAPPG